MEKIKIGGVDRHKLLHAWILIACFSVIFILSNASPQGSWFRRAIYGMPAISLVLWVLFSRHGSIRYDRRYLTALLLYAAATIGSFIFNLEVDFLFFRDVLIVSGAFITFIPFFPVTQRMIKVLLLIMLASLFINFILGFRGEVSGSMDFMSSRGFFESTLAFPTAVIAFYFMIRSEWKWFLLSLIIFVLTFKRIAFGAFLSASVIYYFLRQYGDISPEGRIGWLPTFVPLLVVVILSIAGLNINYIVEIFIYLMTYTFDFITSPDSFTLGRYTMNRAVEELLVERGGLSEWLFGNGPGTGDKFISTYFVTVSNMHNDFLKLRFEYGMVGMILVLAAMFRVYKDFAATLSIFVFSAFLMLTDNTLIYYFYQFTCFIVVRAIINEPSTHLQKSE